MYNKEEFLDKIEEFLKSDKQIALIKGYVTEFKLIAVLAKLQQSGYTKGNIQTRHIGHLKEILKEIEIPKSIKQNESFKVSNLTLQINLYERKNIPFGDFSVYYPVESALKTGKDTSKLLQHIKNNTTPKIFVITTHDWSLDTEQIEQISDETIIYDLEQDDPEQYQVIYKNKNGELPY